MTSRCDTDGARLLRFLWDGQGGLFEVAPENVARRECHRSIDEALAGLPGLTYFGPIARARAAGTKDAAARMGNVLWAEIDAPIPKTQIASRRERGALQRRIEITIDRLDLPPSAIVDSGNRGFHLYWKLLHPIPTAEIEHLNKHLAALLDGDSCWERNRLLRIPGAINRTSGRLALLQALDGTIYTPTEFHCSPLLDHDCDSAVVERAVANTAYPAYPQLAQELWDYISDCPSRGPRYDRSAVEQRIFTALAAQGWSDEEIFAFASRERLPRHVEELRRRGGAWTRASITNARAHLYREFHLVTRPDGGPTRFLRPETEIPVGVSALSSRASPAFHTTDRPAVLRLINGQTVNEFVREVIAIHGCSELTARRNLRQFREGGYVNAELDPADRRRKYLHLTPEGHRALDVGPFSLLHNRLALPTIAVLESRHPIPVGHSAYSYWNVTPTRGELSNTPVTVR